METVLLLGGARRVDVDLVQNLAGELTAAGLVVWNGALWTQPDPNNLGGAAWPDLIDLHRLLAIEPRAGQRAMLASLASVARIVLVLPAQPAAWATLGAAWASRGPSGLKLAVLLSYPQTYADSQRRLGDLPAALACAGLVTDDATRVVSWCCGRLFSDLMPDQRRGRAGGGH